MYLAREDSFLLLDEVRKHAFGKVLDMGTGSAIQALEAADRKEVKEVLAVDIDKGVIAQLKKIITNPKITLKYSNLFSTVVGKFDTIVFNPPYLPQDEGIEDRALYGGKKGYELIGKFFRQVGKHLADEGIILMVFSSFTGKEKVDEMIKKAGFSFKLLKKRRIFCEDLFVYLIKMEK